MKSSLLCCGNSLKDNRQEDNKKLKSQKGEIKMPIVIFDFSGLKNVYSAALNHEDYTLVFETQVGRGRFLFMMFFSPEDTESKDKLFLYLRNTKRLLRIKLYGNHIKGKFEVYLKDLEQQYLIDELCLEKSIGNFNFENFLNQLNNGIPKELRIEEKITNFRDNWNDIKELEIGELLEQGNRGLLRGWGENSNKNYFTCLKA